MVPEGSPLHEPKHLLTIYDCYMLMCVVLECEMMLVIHVLQSAVEQWWCRSIYERYRRICVGSLDDACLSIHIVESDCEVVFILFCYVCTVLFFFFFFKQKTAYEI